MDEDLSGSIGIDELEDPLIALGLVQSRPEVCKIVEIVDEDGSAMVEFDEFLSIIKNGRMCSTKSDSSQDATVPIYTFFK